MSLAASKPGDLAFFRNAKARVVHTGIVLGDKKIVHASGKVRVDALNEEGIQDSASKKITHHLTAIRRIMTE